MKLPAFRRSSSNLSRRAKSGPKKRKRFDGSPRERGYDSVWTKLSKKYRDSVNGLCEECQRRGVINTCNVVDHMIPISEDAGLRLSWQNLDALCHTCHNGFKRRIEQYAKKTQQIRLLQQWIKYPDSRPVHFQFKKVTPSIMDGIIVNQRLDDDYVSATPKLLDYSDLPIDVFECHGDLVSMSNHSNSCIEIADGGIPIQILQDGQSLIAPVEILDGLSIYATDDGAGKISLAYVERAENS